MTDMDSSLDFCDLRLAITQALVRGHWKTPWELHIHPYQWGWWCWWNTEEETEIKGNLRGLKCIWGNPSDTEPVYTATQILTNTDTCQKNKHMEMRESWRQEELRQEKWITNKSFHIYNNKYMNKKKVVGRNSGDRNESFLSIHGDILLFS